MFYLFTQGVCPPGYASPSPARSSSAHSLETVLKNLPESLGHVSEMRLAPLTDKPFVLLLQDAHGQVEAQRNTQKLLDFIDRQLPLKTFFVEGGAGPLDPEKLRLFKEAPLNLAAAKWFLREGDLGGVELFLLEKTGVTQAQEKNSRREFQAQGAEDPELYLENLKLFEKMAQARTESATWLAGELLTLEKKASQILNPRLLRFFRAWIGYEETHTHLEGYLTVLEETAAENAGVRLEDARSQKEWPMLVRFSELKRRQARLDYEAASLDAQQLTAWAKTKGLGGHALVQRLESFSGSHAGPAAIDVRSQWETFYRSAKHEGFSFERYPALSLWEGARILESEMDAKLLMNEVSHLRDRVLQSMTLKPAEQEVIQSYQDYLLLQKLFQLRLDRSDFEKVVQRGDFYALPAGARSVKIFFQDAVRFYQTANAREQRMAELLLHSSDSQKIKVFVSGGFHTPALTQKIREAGLSYAVVSPRMSQVEDENRYWNSLVSEKPLFAAPVLKSVTPGVNASALNHLRAANMLTEWKTPLPGAISRRRSAMRTQIYKTGSRFGTVLQIPSERTVSKQRSEVRADLEELKRDALFILAAHRRSGSLEKFISGNPAVGRFIRQAAQVLEDSDVAARAWKLFEKILVENQPTVAKAVLGSLEGDTLELVHQLQPAAERPEPYWKPEAEPKKPVAAAKAAKPKADAPAKAIRYEPGKLLERLEGLTQREVLRLLNTPEIQWDMGKLRDHLKAAYPKAKIPYFNKIGEIAGGVGSDAGFAIAMGVAAEYLKKVVEIFREERRKPKRAAARLGSNEPSLRYSYTVLKELLESKKDLELADEEDTPGNLLTTIAKSIKDGSLHAIKIEKAPADGKVHVLTWLSEKFPAASEVPEEQIRQRILEWLALPDKDGRSWLVTGIKDQLALLIEDVEANSYSYARTFWGLGLKAEFEKQDKLKDQATGGVLNNTGVAFGWGPKAGAGGLRDFRDALAEIEAKYNGTWTQEAAEQPKAEKHAATAGASLDALKALEMAPADFLEILNSAAVDWSFKRLIAELDKRFAAAPEKKKIVAHLKSRGFDFVIQQLQISEQTRQKIKERLDYYNGVQKLTAQSFEMTDSALRNLSASLGIDVDTYEPPRGNLVVTLGISRDDLLGRLRAKEWKNFAGLKNELIEALRNRTLKGKPVIENMTLNYTDFVRGFGIEAEFLKFVAGHHGRRKFDLLEIGANLGFKNNQLRNMEKLLQHVTAVERWTLPEKDSLVPPQRLAFANTFKLLTDWTRYRAMIDLNAQRPAPVLIQRSWYYDWYNERKQRREFPIAIRRFGEKLEGSIRDLQARHSSIEYFWVEMGPALDSHGDLYPAVYVTGVDLKGQKITEIHQWMDTDNGLKGAEFQDDTDKSLTSLLVQTIPLQGYRLLGAAWDPAILNAKPAGSLADVLKTEDAAAKYRLESLSPVELKPEEQAPGETETPVSFESMDQSSWPAELDSAFSEPAATLALLDQYTSQAERWLEMPLDDAQWEQLGQLAEHIVLLGAALFGKNGFSKPDFKEDQALAVSLSAILTFVWNYRAAAAEKSLALVDTTLTIVAIFHDYNLLSFLPPAAQAVFRELAGDIFYQKPFEDISSAIAEWELALTALEALQPRNFFLEQRLEEKILKAKPDHQEILARHEATQAEMAKRTGYNEAKAKLDGLDETGQRGTEIIAAADAVLEVNPRDAKARSLRDEALLHAQIQTLRDRDMAELWDYLERIDEISSAVDVFENSRSATESGVQRVQDDFQRLQSSIDSNIGARMSRAFLNTIEEKKILSAEAWIKGALRIEVFLRKLENSGRMTSAQGMEFSRTLERSFKRLIDLNLVAKGTATPSLAEELMKSKKADLQAEAKSLTAFGAGTFPSIQKPDVNMQKRLREAVSVFVEALQRGLVDSVRAAAADFVVRLEDLPAEHALRKNEYIKKVDAVVSAVMQKILSAEEFPVWQKKRESARRLVPVKPPAPVQPSAVAATLQPAVEPPVSVAPVTAEPALVQTPEPVSSNEPPAYTWEQASQEARAIISAGLPINPLGEIQKNRQKEVFRTLRELLTGIQHRGAQSLPLMAAFEAELAKLEPNHPLRNTPPLTRTAALLDQIKIMTGMKPKPAVVVTPAVPAVVPAVVTPVVESPTPQPVVEQPVEPAVLPAAPQPVVSEEGEEQPELSPAPTPVTLETVREAPDPEPVLTENEAALKAIEDYIWAGVLEHRNQGHLRWKEIGTEQEIRSYARDHWITAAMIEQYLNSPAEARLYPEDLGEFRKAMTAYRIQNSPEAVLAAQAASLQRQMQAADGTDVAAAQTLLMRAENLLQQNVARSQRHSVDSEVTALSKRIADQARQAADRTLQEIEGAETTFTAEERERRLGRITAAMALLRPAAIPSGPELLQAALDRTQQAFAYLDELQALSTFLTAGTFESLGAVRNVLTRSVPLLQALETAGKSHWRENLNKNRVEIAEGYSDHLITAAQSAKEGAEGAQIPGLLAAETMLKSVDEVLFADAAELLAEEIRILSGKVEQQTKKKQQAEVGEKVTRQKEMEDLLRGAKRDVDTAAKILANEELARILKENSLFKLANKWLAAVAGGGTPDAQLTGRLLTFMNKEKRGKVEGTSGLLFDAVVRMASAKSEVRVSADPSARAAYLESEASGSARDTLLGLERVSAGGGEESSKVPATAAAIEPLVIEFAKEYAETNLQEVLETGIFAASHLWETVESADPKKKTEKKRNRVLIPEAVVYKSAWAVEQMRAFPRWLAARTELKLADIKIVPLNVILDYDERHRVREVTGLFLDRWIYRVSLADAAGAPKDYYISFSPDMIAEFMRGKPFLPVTDAKFPGSIRNMPADNPGLDEKPSLGWVSANNATGKLIYSRAAEKPSENAVRVFSRPLEAGARYEFKARLPREGKQFVWSNGGFLFEKGGEKLTVRLGWEKTHWEKELLKEDGRIIILIDVDTRNDTLIDAATDFFKTQKPEGLVKRMLALKSERGLPAGVTITIIKDELPPEDMADAERDAELFLLPMLRGFLRSLNYTDGADIAEQLSADTVDFHKAGAEVVPDHTSHTSPLTSQRPMNLMMSSVNAPGRSLVLAMPGPRDIVKTRPTYTYRSLLTLHAPTPGSIVPELFIVLPKKKDGLFQINLQTRDRNEKYRKLWHPDPETGAFAIQILPGRKFYFVDAQTNFETQIMFHDALKPNAGNIGMTVWGSPSASLQSPELYASMLLHDVDEGNDFLGLEDAAAQMQFLDEKAHQLLEASHSDESGKALAQWQQVKMAHLLMHPRGSVLSPQVVAELSHWLADKSARSEVRGKRDEKKKKDIKRQAAREEEDQLQTQKWALALKLIFGALIGAYFFDSWVLKISILDPNIPPEKAIGVYFLTVVTMVMGALVPMSFPFWVAQAKFAITQWAHQMERMKASAERRKQRAHEKQLRKQRLDALRKQAQERKSAALTPAADLPVEEIDEDAPEAVKTPFELALSHFEKTFQARLRVYGTSARRKEVSRNVEPVLAEFNQKAGDLILSTEKLFSLTAVDSENFRLQTEEQVTFVRVMIQRRLNELKENEDRVYGAAREKELNRVARALIPWAQAALSHAHDLLAQEPKREFPLEEAKQFFEIQVRQETARLADRLKVRAEDLPSFEAKIDQVRQRLHRELDDDKRTVDGERETERLRQEALVREAEAFEAAKTKVVDLLWSRILRGGNENKFGKEPEVRDFARSWITDTMVQTQLAEGDPLAGAPHRYIDFQKAWDNHVKSKDPQYLREQKVSGALSALLGKGRVDPVLPAVQAALQLLQTETELEASQTKRLQAAVEKVLHAEADQAARDLKREMELVKTISDDLKTRVGAIDTLLNGLSFENWIGLNGSKGRIQSLKTQIEEHDAAVALSLEIQTELAALQAVPLTESGGVETALKRSLSLLQNPKLQAARAQELRAAREALFDRWQADVLQKLRTVLSGLESEKRDPDKVPELELAKRVLAFEEFSERSQELVPLQGEIESAAAILRWLQAADRLALDLAVQNPEQVRVLLEAGEEYDSDTGVWPAKIKARREALAQAFSLNLVERYLEVKEGRELELAAQFLQWLAAVEVYFGADAKILLKDAYDAAAAMQRTVKDRQANAVKRTAQQHADLLAQYLNKPEPIAEAASVFLAEPTFSELINDKNSSSIKKFLERAAQGVVKPNNLDSLQTYLGVHNDGKKILEKKSQADNVTGKPGRQLIEALVKMVVILRRSEVRASSLQEVKDGFVEWVPLYFRKLETGRIQLVEGFGEELGSSETEEFARILGELTDDIAGVLGDEILIELFNQNRDGLFKFLDAFQQNAHSLQQLGDDADQADLIVFLRKGVIVAETLRVLMRQNMRKVEEFLWQAAVFPPNDLQELYPGLIRTDIPGIASTDEKIKDFIRLLMEDFSLAREQAQGTRWESMLPAQISEDFLRTRLTAMLGTDKPEANLKWFSMIYGNLKEQSKIYLFFAAIELAGQLAGQEADFRIFWAIESFHHSIYWKMAHFKFILENARKLDLNLNELADASAMHRVSLSLQEAFDLKYEESGLPIVLRPYTKRAEPIQDGIILVTAQAHPKILDSREASGNGYGKILERLTALVLNPAKIQDAVNGLRYLASGDTVDFNHWREGQEVRFALGDENYSLVLDQQMLQMLLPALRAAAAGKVDLNKIISFLVGSLDTLMRVPPFAGLIPPGSLSSVREAIRHPRQREFHHFLPLLDGSAAVQNRRALDSGTKKMDSVEKQVREQLLQQGYEVISDLIVGGTNSVLFQARDADGRVVMLKVADWDQSRNERTDEQQEYIDSNNESVGSKNGGLVGHDIASLVGYFARGQISVRMKVDGNRAAPQSLNYEVLEYLDENWRRLKIGRRVRTGLELKSVFPTLESAVSFLRQSYETMNQIEAYGIQKTKNPILYWDFYFKNVLFNQTTLAFKLVDLDVSGGDNFSYTQRSQLFAETAAELLQAIAPESSAVRLFEEYAVEENEDLSYQKEKWRELGELLIQAGAQSEVRSQAISLKDKAVLLLPGGGSLVSKMGKVLYEQNETYRKVMDDASKILGYDLADKIFTLSIEELENPIYDEPAIVLTLYALYASLEAELGYPPEEGAIYGLSRGQIAAAMIAGSISFEDGVRLAQQYGEHLSRTPAGAMIQVMGMPAERVEAIAHDLSLDIGVDLGAMSNGDRVMTLSGPEAVIANAKQLIEAEKGTEGHSRISVVQLANGGVASHSRVIQGAVDEIEKFLTTIPVKDPYVPLISNIDGSLLTTAEQVRRELSQHLPNRIRFPQVSETLQSLGANSFIELGTKRRGVLSRFLYKPSLPFEYVDAPAEGDATNWGRFAAKFKTPDMPSSMTDLLREVNQKGMETRTASDDNTEFRQHWIRTNQTIRRALSELPAKPGTAIVMGLGNGNEFAERYRADDPEFLTLKDLAERFDHIVVFDIDRTSTEQTIRSLNDAALQAKFSVHIGDVTGLSGLVARKAKKVIATSSREDVIDNLTEMISNVRIPQKDYSEYGASFLSSSVVMDQIFIQTRMYIYELLKQKFSDLDCSRLSGAEDEKLPLIVAMSVLEGDIQLAFLRSLRTGLNEDGRAFISWTEAQERFMDDGEAGARVVRSVNPMVFTNAQKFAEELFDGPFETYDWVTLAPLQSADSMGISFDVRAALLKPKPVDVASLYQPGELLSVVNTKRLGYGAEILQPQKVKLREDLWDLERVQEPSDSTVYADLAHTAQGFGFHEIARSLNNFSNAGRAAWTIHNHAGKTIGLSILTTPNSENLSSDLREIAAAGETLAERQTAIVPNYQKLGIGAGIGLETLRYLQQTPDAPPRFLYSVLEAGNSISFRFLHRTAEILKLPVYVTPSPDGTTGKYHLLIDLFPFEPHAARVSDILKTFTLLPPDSNEAWRHFEEDSQTNQVEANVADTLASRLRAVASETPMGEAVTQVLPFTEDSTGFQNYFLSFPDLARSLGMNIRNALALLIETGMTFEQLTQRLETLNQEPDLVRIVEASKKNYQQFQNLALVQALLVSDEVRTAVKNFLKKEGGFAFFEQKRTGQAISIFLAARKTRSAAMAFLKAYDPLQMYDSILMAGDEAAEDGEKLTAFWYTLEPLYRQLIALGDSSEEAASRLAYLAKYLKKGRELQLPAMAAGMEWQDWLLEKSVLDFNIEPEVVLAWAEFLRSRPESLPSAQAGVSSRYETLQALLQNVPPTGKLPDGSAQWNDIAIYDPGEGRKQLISVLLIRSPRNQGQYVLSIGDEVMTTLNPDGTMTGDEYWDELLAALQTGIAQPETVAAYTAERQAAKARRMTEMTLVRSEWPAGEYERRQKLLAELTQKNAALEGIEKTKLSLTVFLKALTQLYQAFGYQGEITSFQDVRRGRNDGAENIAALFSTAGSPDDRFLDVPVYQKLDGNIIEFWMNHTLELVDDPQSDQRVRFILSPRYGGKLPLEKEYYEFYSKMVQAGIPVLFDDPGSPNSENQFSKIYLGEYNLQYHDVLARDVPLFPSAAPGELRSEVRSPNQERLEENLLRAVSGIKEIVDREAHFLDLPPEQAGKEAFDALLRMQAAGIVPEERVRRWAAALDTLPTRFSNDLAGGFRDFVTTNNHGIGDIVAFEQAVAVFSVLFDSIADDPESAQKLLRASPDTALGERLVPSTSANFIQEKQKRMEVFSYWIAFGEDWRSFLNSLHPKLADHFILAVEEHGLNAYADIYESLVNSEELKKYIEALEKQNPGIAGFLFAVAPQEWNQLFSFALSDKKFPEASLGLQGLIESSLPHEKGLPPAFRVALWRYLYDITGTPLPSAQSDLGRQFARFEGVQPPLKYSTAYSRYETMARAVFEPELNRQPKDSRSLIEKAQAVTADQLPEKFNKASVQRLLRQERLDILLAVLLSAVSQDLKPKMITLLQFDGELASEILPAVQSLETFLAAQPAISASSRSWLDYLKAALSEDKAGMRTAVASLPADREMRYDFVKRLDAVAASPEIVEEQRGHLEALLALDPDNAALHYFRIKNAVLRFDNAVNRQTSADPDAEFENVLQLVAKAPRKTHPDIPQDLNWDRWILLLYTQWAIYRENRQEVLGNSDPYSFSKEALEIWQGAHARWPQNEPLLRKLYAAYEEYLGIPDARLSLNHDLYRQHLREWLELEKKYYARDSQNLLELMRSYQNAIESGWLSDHRYSEAPAVMREQLDFVKAHEQDLPTSGQSLFFILLDYRPWWGALFETPEFISYFEDYSRWIFLRTDLDKGLYHLAGAVQNDPVLYDKLALDVQAFFMRSEVRAASTFDELTEAMWQVHAHDLTRKTITAVQFKGPVEVMRLLTELMAQHPNVFELAPEDEAKFTAMLARLNSKDGEWFKDELNAKQGSAFHSWQEILATLFVVYYTKAKQAAETIGGISAGRFFHQLDQDAPGQELSRTVLRTTADYSVETVIWEHTGVQIEMSYETPLIPFKRKAAPGSLIRADILKKDTGQSRAERIGFILGNVAPGTPDTLSEVVSAVEEVWQQKYLARDTYQQLGQVLAARIQRMESEIGNDKTIDQLLERLRGFTAADQGAVIDALLKKENSEKAGYIKLFLAENRDKQDWIHTDVFPESFLKTTVLGKLRTAAGFKQLQITVRGQTRGNTFYAEKLILTGVRTAGRSEVRYQNSPVFAVARSMTAKIVRLSDLESGILARLFPPSLRQPEAKLPENDRQWISRFYTALFRQGSSIILPASLLLQSSPAVQRDYLNLLIEALQAASSDSRFTIHDPLIHITGDQNNELKNLFFRLFSPENREEDSFAGVDVSRALKFWREGEGVVAAGLEKQKTRFAAAVTKSTELNSRAFFVDPADVRKLTRIQRVIFQARLTQLLQAASALNEEEFAQLSRELGLNYQTGEAIALTPSAILSSVFAERMNAVALAVSA